MRTVAEVVRSRLLPALITALGVVLITAGLLSYADPTEAGVPTPSPSLAIVLPTDEPTDSPGPTPTDMPLPTLSLEPSSSPAGATPTPAPGRAMATRVVIPALKVDLPIVKGPSGYPYCNVAMYQPQFAQPGENGSVYLYAHARDGMFGPIYHYAIETGQPRKLLGLIVQVYTSDNRLYLYEIKNVYLHQTTYDRPLGAKSEELWLQTSEGPKGTKGKTQVRAVPITSGAADPADAHPKPKPVVCG